MQPEFIQIQSEIAELWWRVPLALLAVIGCLGLIGLAIGSIGEFAAKDHPNKKHLNHHEN